MSEGNRPLWETEIVTLYAADLARVQAEGFGDFAANAAPAIVQMLAAAPLPIRRVYDVGCGAGVSTRALVAAGFETTAVEPSPELLAIARTAAPGATFLEASAYDVKLEACEAVLAIGEVLGYHGPEMDAESRVRRFLETVADALVPRGVLVFDVIEAAGPSLDARGWKATDAWMVASETREDRAALRLTRSIETFLREADGRYRRAYEVHHVRLFEESDMRSWLEAAGFDVETARAYGSAPLLPRRVAFFATRK